MNWKETYTKIFLKQIGKSVNSVSIADYYPRWWQNTRSTDEGGLRLTDEGYEFITTELELQTYDIPFPRDFELTTQAIIWLDKFITCPYYIHRNGIVVTDEKKALELHLFSGDIRKYGLSKAMKRHDSE